MHSCEIGRSWRIVMAPIVVWSGRKPVNRVPWRVMAITVYKLMLRIFGHKVMRRFVYHNSHVGFTSASKWTSFNCSNSPISSILKLSCGQKSFKSLTFNYALMWPRSKATHHRLWTCNKTWADFRVLLSWNLFCCRMFNRYRLLCLEFHFVNGLVNTFLFSNFIRLLKCFHSQSTK